MNKYLLTKKELAENIGCEEGQIDLACFPQRENGGYDMRDVERHFREPEFYEWTRMMLQCYDPMDAKYSEYGGRGIRVCERWHYYDNFLVDMGPKPQRKLN